MRLVPPVLLPFFSVVALLGAGSASAVPIYSVDAPHDFVRGSLYIGVEILVTDGRSTVRVDGGALTIENLIVTDNRITSIEPFGVLQPAIAYEGVLSVEIPSATPYVLAFADPIDGGEFVITIHSASITWGWVGAYPIYLQNAASPFEPRTTSTPVQHTFDADWSLDNAIGARESRGYAGTGSTTTYQDDATAMPRSTLGEGGGYRLEFHSYSRPSRTYTPSFVLRWEAEVGTPLPEPERSVLIGIGLLGIGTFGRAKKRGAGSARAALGA
jgi:hypothetical protein